MHFPGLSKLLLIAVLFYLSPWGEGEVSANAQPQNELLPHPNLLPGGEKESASPTPTYKEVMCNTLSTMTLSVAEAKEKGVPKEKTQAAVGVSIERFKTDTLAANPQTKEWLDQVTPLISDIMKDSTGKIYATIGLTPQQWAEDMLSACVQGMTYLPKETGEQ